MLQIRHTHYRYRKYDRRQRRGYVRCPPELPCNWNSRPLYTENQSRERRLITTKPTEAESRTQQAA